MEEEEEVVIVGVGISGLATALALHRKGVRSVVLERSESLRATGAAIGIITNGWLALHQLGVASKLRLTALPIQRGRDIWLHNGKHQAPPLAIGEARCLKRSDLVTILEENLPVGSIRFGSQVLAVKLDRVTSCPVVELNNGSVIKSRVLIGCEGAHSVVADYLELTPPKLFSIWAVSGFTNYPSGHEFPIEFLPVRGEPLVMGRIPIDHKLAYWFLALVGPPEGHSSIPMDPEPIRQLSLQSIKNFPIEMMEMIANSESDSLSLTRLRYRAPWDILLGRFHKVMVAVAGDAMYVMGPFLGQGGSAGVEDAIVVARCLAHTLKQVESTAGSGRRTIVISKVGEALDQYVKERRMKLVQLSTQTYLVGSLIQTSSSVVKFGCIILMILLFNNPIAHSRYNCGQL
ncbi:FAD_binding_3 domain-containing protein [Cephalotus follicularis]|uniref:FAD_binding_3 domain-containing protein n=1 Tax=Cephalotus follicularis TaxID=3775 RepID=A0A1Q3BVY7_CEPFO|nr:FAD_binding_3 domain-containing protein [Cephalotus follicularis]